MKKVPTYKKYQPGRGLYHYPCAAFSALLSCQITVHRVWNLQLGAGLCLRYILYIKNFNIRG